MMKKFNRDTFKEFVQFLISSYGPNLFQTLASRMYAENLLWKAAENYLEPDVSEENKLFQEELLKISKEFRECSEYVHNNSGTNYERGQQAAFTRALMKINWLIGEIRTWRQDEKD